MSRWSAPVLALGTLCIVVAVFALLGGCKSDSSRARETAIAFLSAFQRGDRPAAEAQLTRAARERGWIGEEIAKSDSRPTGFTVGEPQIEKDAAQVPVTLTGDGKPGEGFLRLRREDGAWKTWGLTFRHDNLEFTLDFEHPENIVGDVARIFGQALGATLNEAAKGVESFFNGISQGARQMERGQQEMQRQFDQARQEMDRAQEQTRRELERTQEETRRELERTRQELERTREELQRATSGPARR